MITIAKYDKNATDKSLPYTIVKMSQEFSCLKTKAEQKLKNFDFVILLFSSSSFVIKKP